MFKKYTNNIKDNFKIGGLFMTDEKLIVNIHDKTRITELILKYISATAILSATTIFTPNFTITSLPALFLSSFVIILLDYMMSIITGINDSSIGRGIIGFVSAAIIIYMTQFIVPGYYISMLSSLIAAAIYGTLNSFMPNEE